MESKDLSTPWVERQRKREYIMDMGIGRGRGKRGLVASQLLLLMKRKSSEPRFDDGGEKTQEECNGDASRFIGTLGYQFVSVVSLGL